MYTETNTYITPAFRARVIAEHRVKTRRYQYEIFTYHDGRECIARIPIDKLLTPRAYRQYQFICWI